MVPESGVLREEAYSEGHRPGAGIYAAHEGVGRRRDAVRKGPDCLPAAGERMCPHAAAPVHGCLDFKCFRRGDRDQGGGGIDRSEYALYVGVLSIGADPAVAKGMGARKVMITDISDIRLAKAAAALFILSGPEAGYLLRPSLETMAR